MKLKNLFLILFSAVSICYAREAVFSGEDYSINLEYNDSACPGDAVFIKMKMVNKKVKNAKKDSLSPKADADFFVDGNKVSTTNFYILPKESTKTSVTFLAGISLSSWWKDTSNFSINIHYSPFGTKQYEFTLPFTMLKKDFVHETLELDEKNTSIKTDQSVERSKQIAKLNKILETTNTESIYSTKQFILPVDSTRRTSFFADRRIYQYTNGKSSTSLHNGIDFGVPEGTAVKACGDGKVVLAENRITTGWSIVIEHLPGLYSLYYHMSELKAKEGDMIKAGETIGLSGSTGLATGPHLHWEIRLNTRETNPDFFLKDFTYEKK